MTLIFPFNSRFTTSTYDEAIIYPWFDGVAYNLSSSQAIDVSGTLASNYVKRTKRTVKRIYKDIINLDPSMTVHRIIFRLTSCGLITELRSNEKRPLYKLPVTGVGLRLYRFALTANFNTGSASATIKDVVTGSTVTTATMIDPELIANELVSGDTGYVLMQDGVPVWIQAVVEVNMPWYGPRGNCGCCGSCCHNGWMNILSMYSSLTADISPYSDTNTMNLITGSSDTCIQESFIAPTIPVFDPFTASTSSPYYLGNSHPSCPFNTTGWFHAALAITGNNTNGEKYRCQMGVYTTCDESNNITYSMYAFLLYGLAGLRCGLAVPGTPTGCLPNPITLGYTGIGTPTVYTKSSGTNLTSTIAGGVFPYSNQAYLCGGAAGDSYYSTGISYLLQTNDPVNFPTSLTLTPDFNPAGISADISLT